MIEQQCTWLDIIDHTAEQPNSPLWNWYSVHFVWRHREFAKLHTVSGKKEATSILGITLTNLNKFSIFLAKSSGWFMPKITKLRLHLLKLFRENYWLLFFRTRCITRMSLQVLSTDELSLRTQPSSVSGTHSGVRSATFSSWVSMDHCNQLLL